MPCNFSTWNSKRAWKKVKLLETENVVENLIQNKDIYKSLICDLTLRVGRGRAHGSGWLPLSNTCTLFCYQSFGQGRCENTFRSIVPESLEHEESCVQLYRNQSKVTALFCCEDTPFGQSRFWRWSTAVNNCWWRADHCQTSHCVTLVMGMASTEIPIVRFIHVP